MVSPKPYVMFTRDLLQPYSRYGFYLLVAPHTGLINKGENRSNSNNNIQQQIQTRALWDTHTNLFPVIHTIICFWINIILTIAEKGDGEKKENLGN